MQARREEQWKQAAATYRTAPWKYLRSTQAALPKTGGPVTRGPRADMHQHHIGEQH